MGVDDLTLTPSSPEINPQSNPSLSDHPDLTLRLSLAGIQTSLTRSSSVIGVISSRQDDQTFKWDFHTQPASFLSLHRSSSLPAHADQPGRLKLNDLQLLTPMEPNNRLPEHRTHKIKSSHGAFSHSYAIQGHGSVESTKGSSSSQSSLESNDREPVVISQTISRPPKNPSKRARVSEGLVEGEGVTNMVQTMPIVSTIGDGPNGRKVEGLLYKYKKGQICIVCVCHGSFLTPAEFVKHAGGREVANPMKHIHVSCTSFSLGNERKQQEQ